MDCWAYIACLFLDLTSPSICLVPTSKLNEYPYHNLCFLVLILKQPLRLFLVWSLLPDYRTDILGHTGSVYWIWDSSPETLILQTLCCSVPSSAAHVCQVELGSSLNLSVAHASHWIKTQCMCKEVVSSTFRSIYSAIILLCIEINSDVLPVFLKILLTLSHFPPSLTWNYHTSELPSLP